MKHTPPLCQRWERGDLLSFSQTDASPSSYIFQAHPQLGPLLSPKPRALLPWAGRSHQHRKRQKSPSHRMQGGEGKGVRMPYYCLPSLPPTPTTFLPCNKSSMALAHQQESRGRISSCSPPRRMMGITILG